jgi:hypothetical protein
MNATQLTVADQKNSFTALLSEAEMLTDHLLQTGDRILKENKEQLDCHKKVLDKVG